MMTSFRAAVVLAIGIGCVVGALTIQAILLETPAWTLVWLAAGALLGIAGVFGLRRELAFLARRRRVEIASFSIGAVLVFVALGYFSARFTWRFDLTEAGLHSLAPQTEQMLASLAKPVHVTFFHDKLMHETRERYELMAAHSPRVTVEFHDPTLNPAKARVMGVQFAGTAVMRSEDRVVQVNGPSEAEIANALLRVTQGAKQRVCFVQGHNEADPFSMESHDHTESSAGTDHSHGLGRDFMLHQRHGLAKARHALETFNYEVHALSLTNGSERLSTCSLLVLAGPKTALLPGEVSAIQAFLRHGGNALFMLDPFIETGLDPVLHEYGISLADDIVIDEASHYWTDVSAPAVTRYNNHQITRDLPLTFFPGARSLEPTSVRIPGTNVSPVVNSSATSFGEHDASSAEFDAQRDKKGPLTLMVVSNRRPIRDNEARAVDLGPNAERNRVELQRLVGDAPARVTARSRVVAVGDSDFATNSFFHFLGNGNLFLNAVNYLSAQEDLIGVEPRTRDLPKLSVTNRQIKGTFVLSMLLIPGLLALVGTLVWWRQK